MAGASPVEESAPPPFLPAAPPHWAARGLAWLVVGVFSSALVGSFAIHVPETVTCPFVLVPVHGADPVRALHAGVVTRLGFREAEPVERGAVLFIVQSEGNSDLAVVAPCSGVVSRSHVRAPGAVVAAGALLSEIACSGEALEAELDVPPSHSGRLKAGQVVKLLYDAFPYQRYGVRYGRLRWVSPAALTDAEHPAFRALVDPQDDGIWVDGERRPFLAGMGGTARIVVGSRRLVAYAFEPIRELEESLAAAPKEKAEGHRGDRGASEAAGVTR
jgi:multidrug efflux pump subunit AcrA (membrane-fusion protein)